MYLLNRILKFLEHHLTLSVLQDMLNGAKPNVYPRATGFSGVSAQNLGMMSHTHTLLDKE